MAEPGPAARIAGGQDRGPAVRDLPGILKGDGARKAAGDAPIIPIILIMLGGYLAWFGIHYWRDTATIWPSDPVKALLQGKSLPAPSRNTTTAAQLTSIEASAAQVSNATAAGAGEGSGGVITPASPAEASWIKAFLGSIGAPPTSANITSVTNWIRHEQAGWPPFTKNNPLNTTQAMPGSYPLPGNTAGVQQYPTAAEGIAATKITIENGRYNDVLLALRGGRGLCGRSWAGLSTWSGGGYSSVC